MPVFLCRWPKGDFSIVAASSREDAIFPLDEWGNAEDAKLWRMRDCMIDFRLDDLGNIEVQHFGERTLPEILERCYPHLDEALTSELPLPEKALRKVVERERKRLLQKKLRGKEADTELGREIQKKMGAASVVVNRLVRGSAIRILKSKAGEGLKPN